jgi:hypothetical protein
LAAAAATATAGSLVAMKAHSYADRRDARAAKKASDADDLLRLITAYGPTQIVADLKSAPRVLLVSLANRIQTDFSDDAARVLRNIRTWGPNDVQTRYTTESIRALADRLITQING